MSSLEEVANVVLRVPCVVLLDLLYRWDMEETPNPAYSTALLHPHLLWSLYCLAHVVCAVLVALPLRHLVNVHLYLLTALLLYVAHRTVRDYLGQEMASHHSGTAYEEQTRLTRSVSTLTGLVMMCTLCSLLMRTRQAWLFSAPVLPLLARLAGLPLSSLPLFSAVSTGLTLLVMSYVALSGLGALRGLFTKAYQELTQEMEPYRLVALAVALWRQLAVSALFLVFWLVLYCLHIYSSLSSKPELLQHQGAVFILLNSVSECCGTPYCLLGLTCTVSYLALGMLNLCKFYLVGYAAFQNGNVMHRGVTEGVTLMLLSLQTGLLEMQVLQRTFLLSIIFFIVVASTLQSMIDIAEPILLALAATRNRSVWQHTRGLSLCLVLLVFPCFMAYKIAYFFHMDFWLLILVSSCLLTSLQVLGALFIYCLFMVELLQDSGVERMDEIIYGVRAISRVLEFLVALCVVAYGTWESVFGEWSWMGVSVIIVHSYFNVWLRAQSGWRSFLLRRKAARKISALPRATEEQLRAHSDVCPICFQDMSVAVITTCGHFFHDDCLKKWLYVQDTCPLCHQPVRAEDAEKEEGEGSDAEIQAEGGEKGILLGEGQEARGESVEASKEGDLGGGAETGAFDLQDVPLLDTTCLEGGEVPARLHTPQNRAVPISSTHKDGEQVMVHQCASAVQGREVLRSELQRHEEQEKLKIFSREDKDQPLCREELSKKALYGEEQQMVPDRGAEEDQKEHKMVNKEDEEAPEVVLHEEAVQAVYGEGGKIAMEALHKESEGGHS